MSDFIEDNLPGIRELFLKMGAESVQADVMARQLLKRAEQISQEQGISEVQAVESLLKKVIEARQDP